MEATVLKLYEYLNQDKIDKIPVYQRNYSWERENCEQLFNDILKAGENEAIEFHFIGSIIVIVDGGIDGNKNIIIDGQQRITTAILFLKALYDTTNNEFIKDEFIKRLLFKITEDGKDSKLILNRDDNVVLKKILYNEELKDEDKTSKVFKNYNYFKNRIPNSEDKKLKIGFEKLRVVGIKLGLTENPQLIFESLNSTGLQLSASDLIRNFLLMSKSAKEQDRLYLNYWYKIEQNITYDYIVEFFKSFLTIKALIVVTPKKVYETFKEYKIKNSIDNEEILQDLVFYSKLYSKLLFPNNENDIDLRNKILDIENLNQKVIYPFILECYANYEKDNLKKEEFLNILNFLENYLIRSIVCEIPSKGLNLFNVTLVKKLNENSESDNKFQAVKMGLILNNSKNRMKSNREFINALKYNKIYSNKTIKNGEFLLYKIESFLSKKEVVAKDNISIEHIMPQTLTKEWRNILEDYKEVHSEYLHTLGNLTLTGYNSELSNRVFSDKKEEFRNSNLSLNRYFEKIEIWNKEAIENRADFLIKIIIENIYPEPKEIDNVDEKIDSFYLFEKNEINVKGLKPRIAGFLDKSFETKNWRDLYVKIVEIIYEKYQELFEKYIKENSFNTNKKILSTTAEEMKGLSYSKIDNFYLNTNLSAEQTLSNLSTIFELFEIDEEELLINLSEEK